MTIIEVCWFVKMFIAYYLYKGKGESDNSLSESQLLLNIERIQNELDELQKEGEHRNQVYQEDPDKNELYKSKSLLRTIEEMQKVVQAYLSSSDIRQTAIGEEILQNNENLSVNDSMAHALSEIIDYTYENNKVTYGSKPLLNIPEDNFNEEFATLESELAKFEAQIGRPDVESLPNIKNALESIMIRIPRPDSKTVEKCKQLTTMLKKELLELIKNYNGTSLFLT
jgi:hypothetical protein